MRPSLEKQPANADPEARSPRGTPSDRPVERAAHQGRVSIGPPALQTQPLGLHVLVVDDHDINRLVAVRILAKLGCTSVAVGDGRAGLEAIEQLRFDAVLMDVRMPVLDGLSATRTQRLREASSGGHLPIVAYTASASASDRLKCLEAGMDDYIAKPICPVRLREVLSRFHQPDSMPR